MKILLLGSGAVASVMTRSLVKDRSVSEIIIGYVDQQRAKKFIPKDKKITLKKVDASKTPAVARAAKEVDLIINASLPNFNVSAMKAALKAGVNYQDLASHLEDLITPEQLLFHKRFERAGLLALVNTGVSPGLSNLLTREGAEKMDRVAGIKIRLIEDQDRRQLISAWSPETALDEITARPLVYRNGRLKLVPSFSQGEEYEYPNFGKRYAVTIYGDEVSTLSKFLKAKNIDVKSTGTDVEMAMTLFKLGLLSNKPIKVGSQSVVPVKLFEKLLPKTPSPAEMIKLIESGAIENARLSLAVEVSGQEMGKKIKNILSVAFPDLREIYHRFPGATYISYPAGVVASVFTKITKDINYHGVIPPECLEEKWRKKIFIELESRGIKINKQYQKAS